MSWRLLTHSRPLPLAMSGHGRRARNTALLIIDMQQVF